MRRFYYCQPYFADLDNKHRVPDHTTGNVRAEILTQLVTPQSTYYSKILSYTVISSNDVLSPPLCRSMAGMSSSLIYKFFFL